MRFDQARSIVSNSLGFFESIVYALIICRVIALDKDDLDISYDCIDESLVCALIVSITLRLIIWINQ